MKTLTLLLLVAALTACEKLPTPDTTAPAPVASAPVDTAAPSIAVTPEAAPSPTPSPDATPNPAATICPEYTTLIPGDEVTPPFCATRSDGIYMPPEDTYANAVAGCSTRQGTQTLCSVAQLKLTHDQAFLVGFSLWTNETSGGMATEYQTFQIPALHDEADKLYYICCSDPVAE